MGLHVTILREADGDDCSNGGLSAFASSLTITNIDGPFEPSAGAPAAMLKQGPRDTVIIVPAVKPGGMIGPMAGGAYVASSDSRFSEALRRLGQTNSHVAIPIHDRFESQDMYDQLTR